MARIPTAESLGLGQGPAKIVPLQGRLQTQASPADFGAQQAQQIGQLGQDIGQAGTTLVRAQAAVDERDARASATNDSLKDTDQWLQTLQQRKDAAPPGAPGFTDGVLKDFDAYHQQALEGLKPGLYRELRDQNLRRLRVNLHEDAIGIEANAKKAKAETDLKTGLGTASSILLTKPEMFPQVLAQQIDLIHSSGMPAAWQEEQARNITAALGKAHWLGRIEQDPRGMLPLLKSQAVPGLEGQDQLTLIDRAQTKVNALDAEDRRNKAEGMATARVALDEGNRSRLALVADGKDPGPMPTDQDWQAAYSPTTWLAAKQRFENQFGRFQTIGRLSSMTLPEMRQALIDQRPDPAKPDYGQQQLEYKALAEAEQAIEAQIKADPAGWAAKRSPALAQAYQSATDAASWGKAIALSLETQRQAGIDEALLQPLPKAQAAVLAKNLVAIADPEQQVTTIKATLDAIPDKAIRKRFALSLEGDGGLPKGFTAAVAALERGDRAAAVRIMTALKGEVAGGGKGPTIADKTQRDAVRTTIANEVARGNRGRVAQLQGGWTGDNREIQRLTDESSLAERLAAYSVAGGMPYDQAARQAAADVWGRDVPTIADPNLAAVTLPAGTDPETVKLGLARIRQGLPVTPDEVRKLIDPQGKGGPLLERQVAAIVDDWKDQARWVNDGERFALLVPIRDALGTVTMRPLPGHRWTLDEVTGVGRPDAQARTQASIYSLGQVAGIEQPIPPTTSPAIPSGLVSDAGDERAAPGVPNPFAVDRAQFHAAVKAAEGGRNVVADDPERAPEDRAAGPMQVMPGTAREVAPQIGITALQGMDNKQTQAWLLAHEDEAQRIGDAYLDQQLDKYQHPAIAAAAYTAGPDRVDKWLAEYGDPRKGEVSLSWWLKKVRGAGFPKTASYVEKVTANLGVPVA